MKTHLKKLVAVAAKITINFCMATKIGRYFLDEILNIAREQKALVVHGQTRLYFCTPNKLNRYRVETFHTKEPETLEWIDGFPEGSVLWDVGANVGLYSCYAAKAKRCKVVSFEPSVFNLEVLARNIFYNGLVGVVSIVPLPLSCSIDTNTLKMTSTESGGALSTFGEEYGWDGESLQKIFEFSTVGLKADDAHEFLKLPRPDYMKLDVDGIEHLILSGSRNLLNNVSGVLIEINDNFNEQASQCEALLTAAGLVLQEKKHSEMFAGIDSFGGGCVWNQIWVRP